MSQHQAKFTWGAGPNTVSVAGGFNNWSDSATPLNKLPDGSFAADIPMPWGEKQAFKYVVDGQWKVREDEAKEWDAAGNMNNVYTAPHAPAPASSHETQSTHKETAAAVAPTPIPAATKEVETPAPAPIAEAPTKADNLLASSAPGSASAGNPYNLGAIVAGGGTNTGARVIESTTVPAVPVVAATATPVAKQPEPVMATAAVPITAAPAVTEPIPVQIEKLAANANIGQAPTGDEEKTIQERATEFGAGALAAISAAATNAAAAVERSTGVDPVAAIERATGMDLHHGSPISVEDAKARGIDVNHIPTTDAETHTASPVGTKPPLSAVEALEEKTQELKIATGADQQQKSVPLPNGNASKSAYAHAPEPLHKSAEDRQNDIPAQDEVKNHQKVPATIITPVSAKDPRKDRTLDSDNNNDTAGTKPITSDPSVSAKDAKKEAERHPAGTGSTPAVAQGLVTETKSPQASASASAPAPTATSPSSAPAVAAGESQARPDATNTNPHVDAPPTPAKDTAPTPPPAAAVAPSTPAKSAAVAPSAASTPASTPAKSTHTREGTANSDVRKRKSGFFHKIKSAFSPKDKEKK